MLWKVLLGLGAVCTVFFAATPPGHYLAKGAWTEAHILAAREPIDRVVADTTVDRATRDKLQLVRAARDYAQNTLGLRAKQSFTTYAKTPSDTLVLVLSVAYRDRLALRTWWWPVVGRVPYKGFFDFAQARREQADYDRDGFDTDLRPSSAFSTLGWFNDPLLSTTLRADSTYLVETVIHELLHNTVWINSDAAFNESFANFVGMQGALAFFRERGDSVLTRRAVRNRAVSRTIGRFYSDAFHSLDSAFSAHPADSGRAARLAARDSVLAAARERLVHDVAPALGIADTMWARRVPLNIASVLARRVYRDDVDDFDTLLVASGGDLRAAITRIADVARAAPTGTAFGAM